MGSTSRPVVATYASPPEAPVTGTLVAYEGDRGDVAGLRRQLERDGYLFLPGFLPRDAVLGARADLAGRLAELGVVRVEGDRLLPGERPQQRMFDDVAGASVPLMELLYGSGGTLMAFFERLFAEPVRHYDFTWLRAYAHGQGTFPHMDSVFMNRGTAQLMTVWTPLGDISRDLGGVAVLSASHHADELTGEYGPRDVDTYCTGSAPEQDRWRGGMSQEAVDLAVSRGLRWLSVDYRAGDVLTFPMFTTHAGLANSTDEVRLSCDSRYQPASHPADERWVGPDPGAHSDRSQRGRIC